MTTPLEQYRKSTYDRTIAKLKQEQEAKQTWLDEQLSKSANPPTQK